jgi:hypothetical protein
VSSMRWPMQREFRVRRRDRLAAWWILWWPVVFAALGVAGTVVILLWVF